MDASNVAKTLNRVSANVGVWVFCQAYTNVLHPLRIIIVECSGQRCVHQSLRIITQDCRVNLSTGHLWDWFVLKSLHRRSCRTAELTGPPPANTRDTIEPDQFDDKPPAVAPVQRFVRPASELMLHPHRIRLVANNIVFDAERNRGNSSIPVARFVEFGEYDKPSQVALAKWVACAGSFPFHYLDRRSRCECLV